jgi:hypothetical protein
MGIIACDQREAFALGSGSDEAIHSSVCDAMDCFAPLAMTVKACDDNRNHSQQRGFCK